MSDIRTSVGFGIERLGLISLHAPRTTLFFLVVLTAVLFAGAFRVGFSGDVREVFKSDSALFSRFEEMTRIFPGSEFDAMLIVEGDLFEKKNLEALRTLHLDMNFIDGVKGVISMLSVRRAPDEKDRLSPLFPANLAKADMEALKKDAVEHPFIKSKLLSSDGGLALFVLALDREITSNEDKQALFAEIRNFAGETLGGHGLNYTLAGKPVLYFEIVQELIRDQLIFKVLGISLSALISWAFFRRLRYVLLATLPPLIASLWLFGIMGWTGQQVTVLTNVVPTLVMVIAFTNSVHMLFGLRRYLGHGLEVQAAMREALLEVGPATVLATLTTSIALLSLMLAGNAYIAGFGLLAAIGALISLTAVLLMTPSLAVFIMRRHSEEVPAKTPHVLRLSEEAGRFVLVHPKPVFIGGLALAIIAGSLHWFNEPHFLYKEYMPSGNATIKAMEKIDARLGGASSLYVYLKWPKDKSVESDQALDLVRSVHHVLSDTPQISNVWSFETVLQWLGSPGRDKLEKLFNHLRSEKTPFNNRLIALDQNAALVTGYMEMLEASRFRPVLDDIDARLEPLRKANPGIGVYVSGIAAVSTWETHNMIWLLNRSLFLAIAFNIVLIGLCFRSARFALYAILPNLTPIAVAGGVLYLTGQGLQFTSIVAFTIAFGIAVDNTIHFLNRFRLEGERGEDTDDAIKGALHTVGPVLIVTTVILSFGMGVTMLSHMPMVQLYGRLTVVILVTALIANMIFLPAILKVAHYRRTK